MAGVNDFIVLDGQKYQVDPKTCRRGTARPFVERFSVGDKNFTGGTPPRTAKGQRLWGGGFQVKHTKSEDHTGFRTSVNCDMRHRDRVVLANSFSATVFNTAANEARVAATPFYDLAIAYSVTSKVWWYKNGTGAWTAGNVVVFSGTDATAFFSDAMGIISATSYLLIGTDKGHVARISVAAGVATMTEVGRPAAAAGENQQTGIRCMAMYDSVLWLGGSNNLSEAQVGTYDGTTYVKKYGQDSLNGASYVGTMLRRYVDSDNTPDQLHWTTTRTGSTTGDNAWHFMWDGTKLRELRYWSDNYPLVAREYDVVGSKGILFGMAKLGSVWRYAGDYTEVLHLDTPDSAYATGINAIAQFGRFIVVPMQDTTNGVSCLWYDGGSWWQSSAAGSTRTGEGSSIAVYRNTIFLVHKETGASRIFELNTGLNFPSTGEVVTSLQDGEFRQTPKEWLSAVTEHAPLRASESIKVEYALEDAGNPAAVVLSYSEDFRTLAYNDVANTTAVWDTDNGKVTVGGVTARDYVGKIAGSVVVNKNIAYTLNSPDPTTEAPGALIGNGSEFSQTQYDNAEADDALSATSGTVAGVIDHMSNAGDTTDESVTSVVWKGQTFRMTVDSTNPSAIIVKAKVKSGTVTLGCRVRHGSTMGAGTLRRSGKVAVSATTAQEYTIELVDVPLAAGAVEPAGTSKNVEFYDTEETSGTGLILRRGANDYANGTTQTSSNAGATWAAGTGDLYMKVYAEGTFGRAVQLYQFDVSGVTLDSILPRYIGYGGSTDDAAANRGVRLSIWNATSLVWETVGTHTAASGGTDAAKTLTGTYSTNPTQYVDAASKIHLLAYSHAYIGVNALASTVVTDFIRLDGSYTTSLKTARSIEVDSVTTGNIVSATLTATTNGSGTYSYFMSADNGTTWEAATSGTLLTFVTAGNQLRWRVDITAASATAEPQLTKIVISYTQPGTGVGAGWTILGTNSTLGSSRTVYDFADLVSSKLINFRLTLGSGGTTTPQLYSHTVEYLVSPDVVETYSFTIVTQKGFTFSDTSEETRTPQTQYDALLALRTARRKPSFTWITGDTKQRVTFATGEFGGDAVGLPADDDEEHSITVPVRLITVLN